MTSAAATFRDMGEEWGGEDILGVLPSGHLKWRIETDLQGTENVEVPKCQEKKRKSESKSLEKN